MSTISRTKKQSLYQIQAQRKVIELKSKKLAFAKRRLAAQKLYFARQKLLGKNRNRRQYVAIRESFGAMGEKDAKIQQQYDTIQCHLAEINKLERELDGYKQKMNAIVEFKSFLTRLEAYDNNVNKFFQTLSSDDTLKYLINYLIFPYLAKLTSLRLYNVVIGSDDDDNDNNQDTIRNKFYAALDRLFSLESLDLSNCQAGPIIVKKIAECQKLSKLTHLDLAGHNIGDDGVKLIATSKTFSNLTNLNLDNNSISQAGISSIASQSSVLTNLTTLGLSGNNIDDQSIKILVNSKKIQRLEVLGLVANNIGPTGASAISHSTSLSRLVRINLRNNCIGDLGLQSLLSSTKLVNLEALGVSYNDIDCDALTKLAELKSTRGMVPKLNELDLDGNCITDIGSIALANLFGSLLSKLTILELSGNEIGDDGAIAILRSLPPKLTVLGLENNHITDVTADQMSNFKQLSHMKHLNLQENMLSEKGIAKFKSSLPKDAFFDFD